MYARCRVRLCAHAHPVCAAAAAVATRASHLSQPARVLQHGLSLAAVPPPPPMQSTYIDRTATSTRVCSDHVMSAFRRRVCTSTDVSMRQAMWLVCALDGGDVCGDAAAASARRSGDIGCDNDVIVPPPPPPPSFGERVRSLSCRWSQKYYGNVTFGPRNFPYASSRWLSRRFHMKKHRILKRFRFRRYKLAAVANLPFARMIRVGMLPELKSSKSKPGDAVDAQLSSQLVSAARQSNEKKVKGKRTRPYSKYQV